MEEMSRPLEYNLTLFQPANVAVFDDFNKNDEFYKISEDSWIGNFVGSDVEILVPKSSLFFYNLQRKTFLLEIFL